VLMFAPLLSLLFVLLFSFKDTVSDDLMGECDVDLNTLDMQEDHEDQEERVFEMMRQGKPAGKTTLLFSRRAVPKGAFAGTLRVTVVRIDAFSDTAGLMDRTDPFISLKVTEEGMCSLATWCGLKRSCCLSFAASFARFPSRFLCSCLSLSLSFSLAVSFTLPLALSLALFGSLSLHSLALFPTLSLSRSISEVLEIKISPLAVLKLQLCIDFSEAQDNVLTI